jgi:hypothetical protein
MALLDHMIALFLILKETSIQFSKTAALHVGKDSRLETMFNCEKIQDNKEERVEEH